MTVTVGKGGAMSVDYDAPRRKAGEDTEDTPLAELTARRKVARSTMADVDVDEDESVELPGADLSEEVLSVRVLPQQADEFTCTRCFLLTHRSRLAAEHTGERICEDCA